MQQKNKCKKIIILTVFIFIPFFGYCQNKKSIEKKKYEVDFFDRMSLKYDYFGFLIENRAVVKKNRFYGYVNKNGILKIMTKFQKAFDFKDGQAIIMINDKYGIIDSNGFFVLSPVYDFIESFSLGLARVSYKSKFGYLDVHGNVIIPFIYDNANSFDDFTGIANVSIKEGSFFINLKGECTQECHNAPADHPRVK